MLRSLVGSEMCIRDRGDFLSEIFDLNEMKCTVEEIDTAIKNGNLDELKILIEKNNARILFNHSSYHDRYFFKLAYDLKREPILNYFLENNILGFDEAKKLNL